MKKLWLFLMCAGATVTLSLPASAKCYNFGVYSKETYCYPDSTETVPDLPFYQPEQIDLPFLEVVRNFAPLTGTASAYLALPAPAGAEELDQRVNDFFVTAHRENDYLAQGIERLGLIIANLDSGIAETTSYIQANVSTTAILTAERDKLQSDLNERVAERNRWQARVTQLRAAANDISLNAQYSRQSVIDLISAVAPQDSLLITSAMIDNAEGLWRQFPAPPDRVTLCCGPAGPAAGEAEPDWRPQDRPLDIDFSAPRDVKLEGLRQLTEVMRDNSARLDALAAEKVAKAAEFVPLRERKTALEWEINSLQGRVEGLKNEMSNTDQEINDAKQKSLDARDKMVLSALQEWLWNSARDKMIVPEIKAFLETNGFDQVAGELGASGILETIEDVRNISWSDVTGIRGLDEFKAVQEKTISLLNPTLSRILQSTEINAWATPEESARFGRSVSERLGDDSVEFFNAAGQVNVDEHYQGLLRNLLSGGEL